MNGEPHVHELKVTNPYGHLFHTVYGDTEVITDPDYPFLKLRLRHAMRKAIRRHDRGSRRAANVEAIAQQAIDKPPRSKWAKAVLIDGPDHG